MPEFGTEFLRWYREINDGLEATREGFVDVGFQVGGKNNYTRKVLDALQKVCNLLIGITIIRGVGGCSFAKECICLIKKSIQLRFSARSKTFARFFSVSPMYFDTIIDKSTR